jgi:hypothetical protein
MLSNPYPVHYIRVQSYESEVTYNRCSHITIIELYKNIKFDQILKAYHTKIATNPSYALGNMGLLTMEEHYNDQRLEVVVYGEDKAHQ